MSQWTHINAVIRYDGINLIGKKLDLGIVCTYEDWDENCNVPCGSEGSIQYQIWENPEKSDLASHTVMFWGDLRDYDNAEEIRAYFDKITKGFAIRSGILEIDIEFKSKLLLQHDGTEWILIQTTTEVTS